MRSHRLCALRVCLPLTAVAETGGFVRAGRAEAEQWKWAKEQIEIKFTAQVCVGGVCGRGVCVRACVERQCKATAPPLSQKVSTAEMAESAAKEMARM